MMGISLLLVFCSASNCYLPLLSSLLTLPVYLSKVSCSFYWSWRRDCRHVRRWVWGRGDRRALTSTLSLKPLQIVPPPTYFPSFCPHSHTCVHWCDEYSLRWTSPDSGHQSLFELAQFLLTLGASRCLAGNVLSMSSGVWCQSDTWPLISTPRGFWPTILHQTAR